MKLLSIIGKIILVYIIMHFYLWIPIVLIYLFYTMIIAPAYIKRVNLGHILSQQVIHEEQNDYWSTPN